MALPTYLIGLGNPGKEYESTRHNIGYRLLQYLAREKGLSWQDKFNGKIAFLPGPEKNEKYTLFFPAGFMNLSGQSSRKLLDFYKLSVSEILAVHDELDLPFGTVQIKKGGGAGGHNGLRSLDQHLPSPDYFRLKIGVGRPLHGRPADFLLSRFSPDEEALMETLLSRIATLILFNPASGKEAGKKLPLLESPNLS